MEFGTGHDVQPGGDITMESSSGDQNLGHATYDSDHDGIADSVIIIQGDHEYLITDADQDGYADAVRALDASGHEIDPHTGHPIDPAGSAPAGTGQGSNAVGDPVRSVAAVPEGAVIGPVDAGSPWPAAAVSPAFSPDGPTAAGVGLLAADGVPTGWGAPTVDLDRDGAADTSVVREPDGAVIGYTDRDGDGVADQMTRIEPDGAVVISVSDGAGGWAVAATGHLDDAGVLVEDPVPQVR